MLSKLDIHVYYRNYQYITNTCAFVESPYYGIWHGFFGFFSKCNKKSTTRLRSLYIVTIYLRWKFLGARTHCNAIWSAAFRFAFNRYGMQRHLWIIIRKNKYKGKITHADHSKTNHKIIYSSLKCSNSLYFLYHFLSYCVIKNCTIFNKFV